MYLFLDETVVRRAPHFFFLRLGPPYPRDWMTSTKPLPSPSPSPPDPTPLSDGLDPPLRARLRANF